MPTAQALWFRWNEGALLLRITTQPGAAKSQIVGLHGGLLKIRIHAPPVDGKANRALVDFLAAAFATPRSRVSVLHGETSRSKTVRVDRPAHFPDELLTLGLTSDGSAASNQTTGSSTIGAAPISTLYAAKKFLADS